MSQLSKLNKYAVNKLKALAVEIEKKQDMDLTDHEIHLLSLRKDIYKTLLDESNKLDF